MRISDLLAKRSSTRKFQNRPISPELLGEILEAGRLSPSGGNEQPWAFGAITDSELIANIAQLAYQQTWIAAAPLLIVLCTIPVEDSRGGRDIQLVRYPEFASKIQGMDADLYWALNQEEHQTKIAGTHMTLAALEHGIGACWVSRFPVKQLAKLLNLPANSLPAEILVFGYPEQEQRPAQKKELQEMVFYNVHS
jgi:nitroreductase